MLKGTIRIITVTGTVIAAAALITLSTTAASASATAASAPGSVAPAGQVTPAVAAATPRAASAAPWPVIAPRRFIAPAPDIADEYELQANHSGDFVLGHGAGHDVTMNAIDATKFFELTSSGSKWVQFQDIGSSECLDLVGSVSAGFKVNEESCNGRSAELWWLVSNGQIQNQYGTSLLNHDACMWNGNVADVLVQKCVASQPNNQIWTIYVII
jgi:hypothetical protein